MDTNVNVPTTYYTKLLKDSIRLDILKEFLDHEIKLSPSELAVLAGVKDINLEMQMRQRPYKN